MKYIKDSQAHLDADGGEDAVTSTQLLEERVNALEAQLSKMPTAAIEDRARTQLDLGHTLVDLQRGALAFETGRSVFDDAITRQDWETAVLACDIMYLADQDESLAALGQGIWLAVTFPVDPELSVAMLQHVVDETPPESEGAAVAAIVAHYLADLRAAGKQRDELMLFTNNLLATVARRQGNVTTQGQFDYWFNKLELGNPEKFLPRLRNITDVMVQDDWWIDREAIWASLPTN